jgi:hypothetical protein
MYIYNIRVYLAISLREIEIHMLCMPMHPCPPLKKKYILFMYIYYLNFNARIRHFPVVSPPGLHQGFALEYLSSNPEFLLHIKAGIPSMGQPYGWMGCKQRMTAPKNPFHTNPSPILTQTPLCYLSKS